MTKKEKEAEQIKRMEIDLFENAIEDISDILNPNAPDVEEIMGKVYMTKSKKDIVKLKVSDLKDFYSNDQKRQAMSVKEDSPSFIEVLESIKINGIISPLIVRPDKEEKNKYEILAGHRRKRIAEILKIDEVPCIVKNNLEDWQASLIMLDENLNRSENEISIMEKAWAYRMKNDALKKRGERTDLSCEKNNKTSTQNEQKLKSDKWTINQLAEDSDESRATIQRYIRLTYLIEDFQEAVDNKIILLTPAVEISFLSEEDQKIVFDAIFITDSKLNLEIAKSIRELAETETLNISNITGLICSIALPKNKSKKINYEKVINTASIPEVIKLNKEKMEIYILDALAFYKEFLDKSPTRLKEYIED